MKSALILGATSAIAEETTRKLAALGSKMVLVGRSQERLEAQAKDLKIRGAHAVHTMALDLNHFETHEVTWSKALGLLGEIDLVFICHGILGSQNEEEQNFAKAHLNLQTNFLSVVSFLTPVANYFEKLQKGTIAVVSSVAGDRGRQSNYLYGTAKGAKTIFLQGLRNRLTKSGVQVLTIKPGFVDTPMTAHIEKGPLFVDPEVIAQGIMKAIKNKRDVVYLPFFWRWIMLIIKLIPEKIFKRLSL